MLQGKKSKPLNVKQKLNEYFQNLNFFKFWKLLG